MSFPPMVRICVQLPQQFSRITDVFIDADVPKGLREFFNLELALDMRRLRHDVCGGLGSSRDVLASSTRQIYENYSTKGSNCY